MEKILVTGALGQIGSELVPALREKYGKSSVIALDLRDSTDQYYEKCDATDKDSLSLIILKHKINIIYHLVGILSATGEKNPNLAWNVNMNSLKHVLDLAVENRIIKVFWPSSIAVFGEDTPKMFTPQHTRYEPSTIYGVTKVAGEMLCKYYFFKYGLDIRSIRYPGLISYKTAPGGGTTDYASAIFFEAVKKGEYTCFLSEKSILPMMYMDDAIRGTMEMMDANPERISVRTSYNFAGISFCPADLVNEIKKHMPKFQCKYMPDDRQKIADSWPKIIDDSNARRDWGWKNRFDLAKMSEHMLKMISELKNDK